MSHAAFPSDGNRVTLRDDGLDLGAPIRECRVNRLYERPHGGLVPRRLAAEPSSSLLLWTTGIGEYQDTRYEYQSVRR